MFNIGMSIQIIDLNSVSSSNISQGSQEYTAAFLSWQKGKIWVHLKYNFERELSQPSLAKPEWLKWLEHTQTQVWV